MCDPEFGRLPLNFPTLSWSFQVPSVHQVLLGRLGVDLRQDRGEGYTMYTIHILLYTKEGYGGSDWCPRRAVIHKTAPCWPSQLAIAGFFVLLFTKILFLWYQIPGGWNTIARSLAQRDYRRRTFRVVYPYLTVMTARSCVFSIFCPWQHTYLPIIHLHIFWPCMRTLQLQFQLICVSLTRSYDKIYLFINYYFKNIYH